jgi:hypothetical protein
LSGSVEGVMSDHDSYSDSSSFQVEDDLMGGCISPS